MKAREVMTSDPAIVMADAPISEAADMMRTRGASLLPVMPYAGAAARQGRGSDLTGAERGGAMPPGFAEASAGSARAVV